MSTQSIGFGTVTVRSLPGNLNTRILPVVLPILLGLVFGPLAAFLISHGSWSYATILVGAIPLAIVLAKYPFAALVIWMAVMPWFPFSGPYKNIHWLFNRTLIPLAFGLVILEHLLGRKKHFPVRLGVASLSMMAFVALGITSILTTKGDIKRIFVFQDQFIVPFLAYGLVRLTHGRGRELRRIMPVVLVLTLAECTIGLISWFAHSELPPIWRFSSLGQRTVGTFGQPAVYAYVLVVFIGLLFHDAMNRRTGTIKVLEILASGLGFFCIFFTFTRGAWIAGLVLLFILLQTYPIRTIMLVAATLVVMFFLSADVITDEIAYAHDRLVTFQEEAVARLVLANAGRRMFYARPIFGWGFSLYDRYDWKFYERIQEYTPTEWQVREGTSHHTYLTILAEMGIFALLFFFLPFAVWLIRTIRVLPHLVQKGLWSQKLLLILWGSIVAHILVAQDLDMRFFYYALTLFWITLGFVANITETATRSAAPATA